MSDSGERPVLVKVFDGTRDGRPIFVEREELQSSGERESILGYLKSGAFALRTTGRTLDQIDSSRGKVVPMSFRTDGKWIWNDAVRYYLEVHGVPPEPRFLAALRAVGFHYSEPSREEISTAGRVLEERRSRR